MIYFWGKLEFKIKNMVLLIIFFIIVYFIYLYNLYKMYGMVFMINVIVNLIIGLMVVCFFIGILIIMGCVCWR